MKPSQEWYDAGVQELNIQHGDRLVRPGELYDRLCAALAAAESAYVAMPPLPPDYEDESDSEL